MHMGLTGGEHEQTLQAARAHTWSSLVLTLPMGRGNWRELDGCGWGRGWCELPAAGGTSFGDYARISFLQKCRKCLHGVEMLPGHSCCAPTFLGKSQDSRAVVGLCVPRMLNGAMEGLYGQGGGPAAAWVRTELVCRLSGGREGAQWATWVNGLSWHL